MARATPKAAPKQRRSASPRKGMRLYKMWLPDMNSPAFVRQARRSALAVVRSEHARADQDFIDSVSILPDLPEYR
ncbi:MAG: DUF3018 family protein, partial [Acidobacteriota bacterium]|nr:DUF3018 family protein [Acidobacteriota bacterium]